MRGCVGGRSAGVDGLIHLLYICLMFVVAQALLSILSVSFFHCALQQDGCAVRHAFYQSFREDFDIMKEAGTCTRAWHRMIRTQAPWTLHMA